MGVAYITKIDPANFNHVWTNVIAQNNPVAYSHPRADLTVSDIDFNPETGDIYVVGAFGAKDLMVSSTPVKTLGTTFSFGNGGTPALSNYSLVASTVAQGLLQGLNSNFVVKINEDGLFQKGAVFGTKDIAMNNRGPKIAFLDNNLY